MTRDTTRARGTARRWVGLFSLFSLAVWLFLALWALLPNLFGMMPTAVLSGSMSPALRAGDVVVAAASDGVGLDPGTIAVFEDPSGPGLVTHRVIAVTPDGDYVTKGDSNLRADSTTISADDIVGIGRLLIPAIALPVAWLRSGDWVMLMLFLTIGATAVVCSRWAFEPVALDLEARLGPYFDRARTEPVRRGRRGPVPDHALGGIALVIAIAAASLPGSAEALFIDTTETSGSSLTAAASFGGPLTYYLHNDPTPPTGGTASHAVLPLDESAPTASTLYNYDTDRDAAAGLLLGKGSGLSETDPTKHQMWSMSVSSAVDLDGTGTLTLWSAMKDFDTTKRGIVMAAVLDCDGAGSSCVTVATGTLDATPWDGGGSGTWVEHSLDLGTISHTVDAGRTLRVKVVVGDSADDDMWFAYDTSGYPSRLDIG